VACAPFSHTNRRRLLSKRGRVASVWQARMPLSPSTITARASRIELATSAMRAEPSDKAMRRTHSAPARVLPKPRPAITSQVRQSPGGGICSARAQNGQ